MAESTEQKSSTWTVFVVLLLGILALFVLFPQQMPTLGQSEEVTLAQQEVRYVTKHLGPTATDRIIDINNRIVSNETINDWVIDTEVALEPVESDVFADLLLNPIRAGASKLFADFQKVLNLYALRVAEIITLAQCFGPVFIAIVILALLQRRIRLRDAKQTSTHQLALGLQGLKWLTFGLLPLVLLPIPITPLAYLAWLFSASIVLAGFIANLQKTT